MPEKLLIVEDEERIARVLQLELEYAGFEVGRASDGHQGLASALSGDWDLILLDVMLPGMSGFEILQRMRQENIQTPVILLTARDTVKEKVSGFEFGANDYITKPFAIEELMARIKNLLRIFKTQSEDPAIRVDDLIIDEKTRLVQRGGKTVELTPKEFDLLLYLAKHKNEVLSREQILSDVWGYDFAGDTNIIDVYIRYLRQKIDTGFGKKLIRTSRGVGYALREPTA
mgnify:CR=1 FL=1|jgi:DNA-binding response OmpR family regulator